jgi:hypothetical protein
MNWKKLFIATALGIAVAFLGAVQIASWSDIGNLRTETASKFEGVSGRLDSIESHQRTLPAEISKDLIGLRCQIIFLDAAGSSISVSQSGDHLPAPHSCPERL